MKIAGIKSNTHDLGGFLKTLSHPEEQIFSPIIPPDSINRFPAAAIVTPLWNIEHNAKIGYLLCLLNLRTLIENISFEYENTLTDTVPDKQLILIDHAGMTLVVPWNYLVNSVHTPDKNNPNYGILVLSAAKQNEPESHIGRHQESDGNVMFGQSMKLKSNGWDVLIELNVNEAMQPINDLKTTLIVLAVIISLSTLLLLFFPVQFLIRPLSELQKMAFRIKEGDFSARVQSTSQDEIGHLANTFNLMSEAIEERTRSLQKQENELRVQHNRLNTVVNSMSDGLILLNNRNEIILSNAAAKPLINTIYRENDAFSVRKCTRSSPDHDDCLACLLDTGRLTNCVLQVDQRIFEIVSTKLPSGKILVARDITEREKMAEQQAHEERLAVLGRTAAVVAHEINSPLAAISMYNQMMETELSKDSAFQEHVDVIKRNTETCQRIIRELLDYARLPEPKTAIIDLQPIIVNVIRFLHPIYEKKNTVIKYRFHSDTIKISGDEAQMKQVFVNLLNNAIQAVPDDAGLIEIVTEQSRENGSVVIDMQDNGSGVDAKVRDEIFEPFFTTKSSSGTGLGLSTTRQILRAHGGDIVLLSSVKGRTTFRITLPQAAEKSKRHAERKKITIAGSK